MIVQIYADKSINQLIKGNEEEEAEVHQVHLIPHLHQASRRKSKDIVIKKNKKT